MAGNNFKHCSVLFFAYTIKRLYDVEGTIQNRFSSYKIDLTITDKPIDYITTFIPIHTEVYWKVDSEYIQGTLYVKKDGKYVLGFDVQTR